MPQPVSTDRNRLTVDEVIITEDLSRRSSRLPDYQAENRALAALAQSLADSPETLLQRVVDSALELCHGESAGISLDENGLIRWKATAGTLFSSLDSTIPRHFCPCGVALDRNVSVLMADPARYYPQIADLIPPNREILVVPFSHEGVPIGTLWVITHATHTFDAEDHRIATGLSRFAAAAIRTLGLPKKAGPSQYLTSDPHASAILESINEGFVVLDSNWKFVYVNAAFERLNGVRREDVIGRDHWEVYPDTVGTRLEEEYRRTLATGRTSEFENHYESQNRWFMVKAYPAAEGGLCVHVREVTADKQAEQALRDSESRYRAIVEATPECVKLVGLDGTLLQMNSAGLAMVEADESALGQCVYNVIAPEFREVFQAFNEQVCRGNGGTLEFDIVGQKGTRRHMETKAVPLPASNGMFTHLAVTRDVTLRRQTEAALSRVTAESERLRRLYEAILTSTPDLVYVFGRDHRFTYANSALLTMWGRNWDEAIGKDCLELGYEPWHAAMHNREIDQVFATKKAIRGEVPFTGTYGRRIYDYIFVPVIGADGEVEAVAGTTRDVTERKEFEESLQKSEERYRQAAAEAAQAAQSNAKFRAFFEQGTNYAGVLTLDGTLVEANRLCLDACGFARDDMIGKPFWECGWWNRSATLMRMVHEACAQAAKGRQFRAESNYFVADGSERFVDLILAPVKSAEGDVLFVAATGIDITDRRAMEDALRTADRKKDDFIALLSHELRNPLAPLRNGLQVLRLAEINVEAARRAREMMDRQLTHLVRLVDDLLDVSRISRNKMELRRERVTLADVLGSAIETARPMIESAGHELTVTYPPEPIYLDADLTRLAQVFSNLMSNSAKYTPRGGRIWITGERSESRVMVSVQDNGIGIPPESLGQIFDMFSQVDRSIERSTGGLGIGLALVRGLVEMHGGTVMSASEGEGRGSTFTVTLPVVEERSEMTPALAINAAKSQAIRILVVDDNHDGAESMADMLTILGYTVRTAHDGLEAIKQAEDFRPEVILMDVGMPRLNGLEATHRIREQSWGRDIVIIALTGWGQENDRNLSWAAGCDGHLVKPVSLPVLQKLIGELCENDR